jgi:hypothetical protein
VRGNVAIYAIDSRACRPWRRAAMPAAAAAAAWAVLGQLGAQQFQQLNASQDS